MTAWFSMQTEKAALRLSVLCTVLIAILGIVFGAISGSFSIMFDGIYSLTDASMSLLSLMVVNLITAHAASGTMSPRLRERFSMGFWHLEPIVLGLNGTLLIGVAVYALINAVASILDGGTQLQFGWAMLYALVTLIACVTIAVFERRANRKIQSDFLALDVKGWIMTGSITAALLIAFTIGFLIQGTGYAWISPYIDPAVLALVCVMIIPLPIGTIRKALADVMMVTPVDLQRHVSEVAEAFAHEQGLLSYRAYVARIGRLSQIELYFIVPAEAPARSIAQWDALRDEVGLRLGGEGPDRWLTVVFTGDLGWAE